MHTHFLDPYRHRVSLVHQLDARIKLVLALAFILAVALTPPGVWPIYVLLLALVVSVELLSELGLGYVWKRAIVALPFALAALPMLFTVPGAPLVSVQLGPWSLTISDQGLTRFISVLLKSWLSLQMAIVLASTTPFPELLQAMRAVGAPRLLVVVIGLMWRYLFVLVDEALRLLRARAARSGGVPAPGRRLGGTLLWRARVAGGMAGNLFLRAFDRAERIYAAMAARGYDGEVRSLPTPPAPWRQRLFAAAGLVTLALLVALGYLL